MKRVLLIALLALGVLAPAAGAHPLGNFSINHLDVVRVSKDRVDVRYILDQAEIPTFQERGQKPSRVLTRKRAEVAGGVTLTVGGRPVPLKLAPGGRITFPMGQGGLRTTRVELLLRASTPAAGAGDVVVRDETFADRVGWKAVVVAPGSGTAVRSDVTSDDPTQRLRRYPTALLSSPANRPVAHLRVEPGAGTVTAPRTAGGTETTRDRGGSDRFAGVFERAAAGQGVLLLFLLAAFGWGALHALSPGHGKAMVAAYLVGARGRSRHAVALGLTVTVTHTIGVFALGLVTLALSQYVLPEQLYPWLNLVSGLLVLGVGAAVLRGRFAHAHHHAHGHDHAHSDDHAHGHDHDHDHGHGHGHSHDHGHDHDHDHGHGHEHGHDHAHGHEHGHAHSHEQGHGHGHTHDHEHDHSHGHDHDHSHGHDHGHTHTHSHGLFGRRHHHHHHTPSELRPRALLAMGISAGLIPCPSALVVLLGAVAQHQIALGLVLICAFSAGLAFTLTALGLLVVHAARLSNRIRVNRRAVALMPALSSVAIVALGVVLTAQAFPKVL